MATARNRTMTALAEINHKAHALLRRELGPVDYARFLQQFDAGHGDYTAERQQQPEEDSHAVHQRVMKAKARGRVFMPPNARTVEK